jgi:hypothetical protein
VSARTDGVASWADHLRRGGTTTWREWRTAPDNPDPHAGAVGGAGATQLEVVRRLADARPGLAAFPVLADRVLRTPAAGRGPVDVPLPGDPHTFGAPAAEPDLLPATELLRVASAVLAGLMGPAQPAAPEPPSPGRWWRRGVVVHGSPVAARHVRAAVRAAGLPDGGRRARHVVLGGPLEQMMFEAWVTRIHRGGGVRWARFWDLRVAGDALPGTVDVATRAAALADGRRRVDVVLGADTAATAAAALRLLGLPAATPADPLLDVATTEARRRLNLCAPTAAVPAGLFRPGDVHALAAPASHRVWADQTAARIVDALSGRGDGYAVHGDPAVVVRRSSGAAAPDLDAALAATLTAIADAWVDRRHDEEEG